MRLLDPTAQLEDLNRRPAPRLAGHDGVTVGLLDISKPRGDIFLDEISSQLVAAGAVVKRYMKQTFAKPASPDLQAKIAKECGAVVEALAD